MRHLPERMNAGVRSARAMHENFFLRDFARRIRERPLYGCQSRLNLPTVEVGRPHTRSSA